MAHIGKHFLGQLYAWVSIRRARRAEDSTVDDRRSAHFFVGVGQASVGGQARN